MLQDTEQHVTFIQRLGLGLLITVVSLLAVLLADWGGCRAGEKARRELIRRAGRK